MSTQLKLAGRYLAGRKLRTALTTLAIVLGVMIIFGLNGVLPGMMELMQRSMLASVGEVDLTVENASSGLFPAEVAEEVAGVEGIAAATPVLRRTVALPPEPDYGTANVSVIGIAPDTAGEVRAFPVAEGRMLTEGDDVRGSERPAAVLTASTAEETGLSVGDALQMPAASGTVTFEVVGTIDTPAAAGAQEVYVPLATAQEMFETPGLVTAVDAAFAASVERSAIEAGVQDALGDSYVIGAIAADSPLVAGFAAGEAIMNLIGVFVLAMGGFVILNTFRTMVAERRHDIGMLRAIGASRRTILGLFLTESLVQGLLGTGLGLLAGWGFAAMAARTLGGIVEDLVHMGSFDLVFPLEAWVLSISLGVGITVLSAILPARAASRITPLDALRPQIGDVYEKAATRRAWVGLALIAIAVAALVSRDAGLTGLGVILLLVGMALGASAAVKPVSDRFSRAIELVYRTEGGLARANLQRNPGRAGATASAVMISIGLVVATMSLTSAVVGGYEEYAEKATGSDFIVLPQSFMFSGGAVGAGPEMAEEIAATDGIGDVATLRYAPGVAGDLTIQVIGIDPAAYGRIASFRYAEGSSDADLAKLSEPGMLLANGSFRGQLRVGKGDTVEIMTTQGAREFTVAAGGNDYVNAKLPTVYVSQDTLAQLWGVTTDVMVLANAEDGADKAAVLSRLEGTVGGFPAFTLHDTTSWANVQKTMFDQLTAVYTFMAVLMAVPSLLALLNTLAIGVLARTREIGMLRAVGATRRQVKRLVVAESMLLSALGTVAGLVAGIPLGNLVLVAIQSVGLEFDFVFPWSGLMAAVAVGLVFAALAALIPARQAAKLDIIRALRYE